MASGGNFTNIDPRRMDQFRTHIKALSLERMPWEKATDDFVAINARLKQILEEGKKA